MSFGVSGVDVGTAEILFLKITWPVKIAKVSKCLLTIVHVIIFKQLAGRSCSHTRQHKHVDTISKIYKSLGEGPKCQRKEKKRKENKIK